MKKRMTIGILLLFSFFYGFSQPGDSIAVMNGLETTVVPDSLAGKKKKREKELKPGYPNPKKAAFLSLAFPGAGQIYNKRWWKLPLVYGALGGVAFAIKYNTTQFKRMDTALELARNMEEHEFTGTGIDNVQALKSLRDQFDKNKQLSYIGMVFIYMLQSVEAFVDAHLKSFDIDDDLSMKIKPVFEMNLSLGQPVLGIGLNLKLGAKNNVRPITYFNSF